MPSWDDPFIPEYGEIVAAKEDTYENALVKELLKLTENVKLQRTLLKEGDNTLRFQDFARHVGFPMWLEHREVKTDADSFLQLLGAPTKSPIYQTLLSVREEVPAEYAQRHAGLVFRWTGWGKFIVIHDRPSERLEGGGQFRFWIGRSRVQLVLERLEDLIVELGGPDEFQFSYQ